MEHTDIVLLTVIISLLIFIAFIGGCAMFQAGTNSGDTLIDLPETGTQAMFQTLRRANWLYTLSIIGIGAGFYAFLNGSGKGLQIMAACFVVLSLIIGITRYSAIIAAIAMIGAVCLMVYSTVVKNKALREVIAGVQKTRDVMRVGSRVGIMKPQIGAVEMDDRLSEMQSKTTEAIVKAVKGTL